MRGGSAGGFDSHLLLRPVLVTGALGTVTVHYRVLIDDLGEGGLGATMGRPSVMTGLQTMDCAPRRLGRLGITATWLMGLP